MDLHTIAEILRPTNDSETKRWHPGCAWLAGGTWLFSEPQLSTHTLIDIDGLNWPPLTVSPAGLEIAATCKIVQIHEFAPPPGWKAASLFQECSRAFLASFKIWNEATVGGNLVLALPAGPMISLTAALEGVCTLWPQNAPARTLSVLDLVIGNHQNSLAPGELLRSVFLPIASLKKRFAIRRFSLTELGRSEALVIGTLCPDSGEFVLTVTASTVRPFQKRFSSLPSETTLRAFIDEIPISQYLDDPHGTPSHRRHLTYYFSEQIRRELSA